MNVANFAPFINGSYGVATLFLLGAGITTWRRYRLAVKRLNAVDARR